MLTSPPHTSAGMNGLEPSPPPPVIRPGGRPGRPARQQHRGVGRQPRAVARRAAERLCGRRVHLHLHPHRDASGAGGRTIGLRAADNRDEQAATRRQIGRQPHHRLRAQWHLCAARLLLGRRRRRPAAQVQLLQVHLLRRQRHRQRLGTGESRRRSVPHAATRHPPSRGPAVAARDRRGSLWRDGERGGGRDGATAARDRRGGGRLGALARG